MREFLDGVRQAHLGVDVEFLVIGSILRGRCADVCGLIKTAAPEGNGKRLETVARSGRGVVQNGGGIDASAEPDA